MCRTNNIEYVHIVFIYASETLKIFSNNKINKNYFIVLLIIK